MPVFQNVQNHSDVEIQRKKYLFMYLFIGPIRHKKYPEANTF